MQLVLEATLRAMALPPGDARAVLAESTVWLALANLGPEPLAGLEPHLAGDPARARVAVGVALQRSAADVLVGAAERALCALACVALGSADPLTGQALQPGLGGLRLLEIVEQIPVAAQIRLLLLEFRHLRLEAEVPATFLARVEDILERFDVERLTGVRLGDRPQLPREAALERVAAPAPRRPRRPPARKKRPRRKT